MRAVVLIGRWKGQMVEIMGKVPNQTPEAWYVKAPNESVIMLFTDELSFIDEPKRFNQI